MKIFLNGKEVNLNLFVVNNGLNYGRFFNVKTEVFELLLSKAELYQILEKEYNKVRDEIKMDDELNKDTSDFTNTNYCTLSELLNYKEDFTEIIKGYLDRTLFLKIFGTTNTAQFVINSTDNIDICKDFIKITGSVFRKACI